MAVEKKKYVNISGSFFEETPSGLTAVSDPTILGQLKSGALAAEVRGIEGAKFTPPSTTSTTSTNPSIPPTISLDTGMSASFLTETMADISKRLAELEKMYPSPEETAEAERRASELRRKEIEARFRGAREEIEETREAGMREIARAGEALRMPEAIVSKRIKEFQDASETFLSNIAKSIERLTEEEQRAYEMEDLNYANQIRQAKLDYINTQRQFMQDKFNMLTNMFNIMLTGKQLARQEKIDAQSEAIDILNRITSTYGGTGRSYESLPQNVKNIIEEKAEIAGIPLDVIKTQISTLKRDLQIVREGDYTSIYDKNTGQRLQRYYAPATNSLSQLAQDTNELVQQWTTAPHSKDGYMDVDDYLKLMDLWKRMAPQHLKTFYLAYNPDNYLNPNERDKVKKDKITKIKAEAQQFMKATDIAMAFLESLIRSGGLPLPTGQQPQQQPEQQGSQQYSQSDTQSDIGIYD